MAPIKEKNINKYFFISLTTGLSYGILEKILLINNSLNEGRPMSSDIRSYPVPSLKRLPAYLQFLKKLAEAGREVVPGTHIAQDLRLDPTQVRKDLEITGINGRPRIGYSVPELIAAIEDFLGWNNTTDAFLAGAGSLGTALIGYGSFREYGLNIVAAFDADEKKIGKNIRSIEVLPVYKLPEMAERMHIHIGIITVPAEVAQDVTDLMVFGGIKAIWNFAPANITVPEGIIVENVQLSSSLAVLTHKLAELQRRGGDTAFQKEQKEQTVKGTETFAGRL
jgi:redox-sensing transcriptional repressor